MNFTVGIRHTSKLLIHARKLLQITFCAHFVSTGSTYPSKIHLAGTDSHYQMFGQFCQLHFLK